MTSRQIGFIAGLVLVLPMAARADWTEFRGPGGTSVAKGALPADWSESKNIAWTRDLPGRGLSGPIVIGAQVIVTASSGANGDRLHVLSLDLASGDVQWHRQFWASGSLACHPKMCMATPTPTTDGKRILAFFSSNDLACLDLEGNLLWYRGLTRDYPNASNSVGMSASPVIVDGVAIVSVESEGDSFLAGIDMETGKNLWREPRPRSAQWASPIALRGENDEPLVMTQSRDGVFVRKPKTGEVIWKLARDTSTIPSATIAGDRVFVPSDGILAAKLDWNAAEPAILWETKRVRAGTASPLYHDGKVYAIQSAILNCADAATGEPLWKLRLKGNFSSTPVIAGNRMYAFNEDGIGFVVDLTGEEGKILSENKLGSSKDNPDAGETILCSPAIAGDALFVRSDQHLWKITQTP